LYYVYIGTNDYSLNYFQPELYNTSGTYNPDEYAQVLIDELPNYLHVRARVRMCVCVCISFLSKYVFNLYLVCCFTVSINHYIFGEQALYDVGSKKFVLHGLGKIGCTPIIRANSANNGSCVEDSNDVEAILTEKLRSLVDQSNTLYLDSKFIFINITAIRVDISLGKHSN